MSGEKLWLPLDLVKVTADYLGSRRVPSPRLDAEVLLCEVLGLARRVDLYAGFEREISGKELAAYRELIKRRAAREPVSRILGRRDFMGLSFSVTPDVLSPRPETELLVEAALELFRPKRPETPEPAAPEEAEPEADGVAEALAQYLDDYARDADSDEEPETAGPAKPARAPGGMAAGKKREAAPRPPPSDPAFAALDLGTGSGCIAVALAALCPGARVTAVDASPKALAVAKKNAKAAGVEARVQFRQGDWFAACRDGDRYDVVLSNPPYLVEGDPDIWPEVSRYDPPTALYGGKDGLDCYRRLIPDAAEWLAPEGWLLLETGAGQAARVAEMLRGRGFREVNVGRDYAGVDRVVRAKAPGL